MKIVLIKFLCEKNKILSKFVNNINSKNYINCIKSLKSYIIFCFEWPCILKNLLSLAPIGILGYYLIKITTK